MRKFEVVTGYKDADPPIPLPRRATAKSAGYDIAAASDVVIAPNEFGKIPTGLKAYMPEDEFLRLVPRSSLAVKRGLLVIEGTIDADYVDNPENEGHIAVVIYNPHPEPVLISKGERIAQGVFMEYWTTDDDEPVAQERVGGFGSTGQ